MVCLLTSAFQLATHRAVQVQTILRVKWIKQIAQTPDRNLRQSSILKVYPLTTALRLTTHRSMQVQRTPRVWINQTPNHNPPAIIHPQGISTNHCPSIGHSSGSAGTNDASSKMDKTDRSNSRPQSSAIVHLQGISTNHCPSIGHSSSSAATNDASSKMDETDQSNSRPQSPAIVYPQGILSTNLHPYDWPLIKLCRYS